MGIMRGANALADFYLVDREELALLVGVKSKSDGAILTDALKSKRRRTKAMEVWSVLSVTR